ncbi:hypothetical protein Glove_578g40 [Diversispora epigaea]|uniref:Uncharacterized protein n=1 Tax=Diversispora epigaea TaxID=1348612 RepID=A0A397GDU6_9GLOM|nr:hypothetical protein Glove_578g40 [Diversispora epigaea]
MPRKKRKNIKLQEYNKRRRLSINEKEDTATDKENVEANEREEEENEEKIRTCLLATALIWNESEKNNKRMIKGIPKTTYYRKSADLSAGGSSSGFVNESTGSSLVSPTLPGSLDETNKDSTLCERIIQLQNVLLKNEKTLTAFEYNRQRAVYEYLIRLNNGNRKIKFSEEAAHMVYIVSKPYTAKWIRSLAKFYLDYKSFPVSHIPATQIQNPNAEIPNAEIPNPKSQIIITTEIIGFDQKILRFAGVT